MPKNGKDGKEIGNLDELKIEEKQNNNKNTNKVYQALNLPTICNVNPRSIYNKKEAFHTLIKEEQLDSIFISESWERNNETLDKIIKLDDHVVISNVSQRTGKGGRPAIIANCRKFDVQNITNSLIQIPWGVEAVWCILTPKNAGKNSKITKIACCSLYSKPDSRKKTLLLDHISNSFNILSTKYGRGLEFIIAGDTNDLNLEPILSLSPKFQQIVKDWTRMNPPALLDPILTTMPSYYQVPECLEPLDADADQGGVQSDHRVVIARPISEFNNISARMTRHVKVRPFPESGIEKMKEWFVNKSWEEIYTAETAHEKAAKFQNILLEVLDAIFPEKLQKLSNVDQPWINHKLKILDRKRKRIYRKERRSEKWKSMDKLFKQEVKSAKNKFYKEKIEDLKTKKKHKF